MDDFVLDDLGGIALEDLHLHGLVSDNQVAHRVLLLIVLGLGLLCLLLCDLLLCLLLCLLLQLVLLLSLLLGLLLCLLLGGLLLLLLNQSVLVGLLDHNQLLLLGLSLLLSLRLRLALATTSLILLEMLALVEHQVILLEEGLSALANVCSHRAASIRMASIVQQQSVFSRESFSAVAAIVGFGFRLCHHDRLLVLYLLDLRRLLNNLYLLLGLLVLHLLGLLVLLYLDLLLRRALRLQRLLYHLTRGGDNLYLVDSWEQMARNGSR